MENKFDKVMQVKDDSELLEIVTIFRSEYQEDAVFAAEKELQKRNLSTESIEKAKKKIEEREEIKINHQKEELDVAQKILFFIFFWGVIPWSIAGTFNAKGYVKKYKDAWKFMKYGMLTYLIFFIIMILVINIFVK